MKKLLLLSLLSGLLFASIDINNATLKELSDLKGVGQTKAQAIIDYRESNCFKSIDELSNVKGIGKKTVEKNIDNLTVGECS